MAAKFAKFRGLPELLAKLNELASPAEIERIAYRGTYGSAKDLRDSLVASIRGDPKLKSQDPHGYKYTGALEAGPAMKKIRVDGTRLGYTVGFRAGPFASKKMKAAGQDPYYWWILEFGSAHSQAFGFFRRAIESHKAFALPTILAQARSAVLASGNRLARKHGNGGARATP